MMFIYAFATGVDILHIITYPWNISHTDINKCFTIVTWMKNDE